MEIWAAVIDKTRQGPEKDLVADYQQRLKGFGWSLHFKSQSVKKNLSGSALKAAEAELLRGALPSGVPYIALDERGRNLSTRELSEFIEKLAVPKLGFCIGGADGLDESLVSGARLVLSFGKLTWPHRLVLPMLAEQIYRVASIQNNHPYHRD